MSFLPRIGPSPPDYASLGERDLEEPNSQHHAGPLSASIASSRKAGALEFRDVTKERSADASSSSKRTFGSAFFSYVSYVSDWLGFSRDSSRDVTSNNTSSEILDIGIEGIRERAAAVVKERSEDHQIIHEYDRHYDECIKFYAEQKDFLENYLTYLQDALNDLRDMLQECGQLPRVKGPAAAASEIGATSLIDSIQHSLESLKAIPELELLIEKTQNLVFNNKKENNRRIQSSAKDLADIIEVEISYFRNCRASNDSLREWASQLMNKPVRLLVTLDSKGEVVVKAESAGLNALTENERAVKSEELSTMKGKMERVRLSLLNHMRIFQGEVEETTNLISQKTKLLVQEQVIEDTKKHADAYRNSPLRYKI